MTTATLDQKRAQAARDRRAMIPLLRAVAAMVLFSLAMVTIARIMGVQPAATPDDTTPVAQERMIVIISSLDGSARIDDEDGGCSPISVRCRPGFIGGVDRSLARVRMQQQGRGQPARAAGPVRRRPARDPRPVDRVARRAGRASAKPIGTSFLALLAD